MKANNVRYALIIDDEEAIRTYVQFSLETEGFTVTTCSNGNEGLQEFLSHRFDIVITDIMMPGKDGIETIIEIRRLNPPVPIVAISGVDSHKALLRIANIFRADATLKKPFTKYELLAAVQKALGSTNDDAVR